MGCRRSDLDDPVLRHREHSVEPGPADRVHAGEAAEGRQHADLRAEAETRRAQVDSTRAVSTVNVSVVVPRGTGTPHLRNDTALPMCASATSKVDRSSRKAAFCGSKVSAWPPTASVAMGCVESSHHQAQRG